MVDISRSIDETKGACDKFDQIAKSKSQEAIVKSLAELSPLDYDQVRDEKAKLLNVRTGTLDKEVTKARGDLADADTDDVVEELSPWDEPVDGNKLLNDLAAIITRHVILPNGAVPALSLWALGSYCMDAWRVWPKLLITSPEKRCGKSTLLETVEGTVNRSLLTSNISPSAIFRCIEEWAPTLLIDEADTFTKDNDELNGVINAGHTKRTAAVIRSEKIGNSFKPRKFSVWCPQVIAGIGEQRGTLHDRSIHIELRRKLPDECSVKLPADYYERMKTIRRKCLRWAVDNINQLRGLDVEAPDCGNDRAQDNWSPLFMITSLVGGDWPEKVNGAYLRFNESEHDDSDNAGLMLLSDIKEIFEAKRVTKIASAALVDELTKLADRPWFEWKRGKPLTQNSLSRLLKPYHILPGTIRISDTYTAKGYKQSSFEDAFTRYLSNSPFQSVTTPQPAPHKALETISKRHTKNDVTVSKPLKPAPRKGCADVTVENDTIETTPTEII